MNTLQLQEKLDLLSNQALSLFQVLLLAPKNLYHWIISKIKNKKNMHTLVERIKIQNEKKRGEKGGERRSERETKLNFPTQSTKTHRNQPIRLDRLNELRPYFE